MSDIRRNTAGMLPGRPTWAAVGVQLLLVVATSTVIFWVNQEFIVPRGARAHFMASLLSTSAADPVDFLKKADRLGILLLPAAAVVWIAFVALVAQLAVLLQGRILSLAEAVRAATWAFWGVVYGMAAQSLWLWRPGMGHVTVDDSSVVPEFIAHVLQVDIDSSLTVYLLAVQFSITAVVWLLGLGFGLAFAEGVDTRVALRSIAFVWVTVLFGTASLALLGRVLLA